MFALNFIMFNYFCMAVYLLYKYVKLDSLARVKDHMSAHICTMFFGVLLAPLLYWLDRND